MINFHYEIDFNLINEASYSAWLSSVILFEQKKEGEINYIFCDDAYLHKLNLQYLDHDNFTDIISFDYSLGNELHGDIFISIERVTENAVDYDVSMEEELRRVMCHGILHYCGFKDKLEADIIVMREKEDEMTALFSNQ